MKARDLGAVRKQRAVMLGIIQGLDGEYSLTSPRTCLYLFHGSQQEGCPQS